MHRTHRTARGTITALCIAGLAPAMAMALTIEGVDYPSTITMASKPLKLIGAGIREKFWVNVYAAGFYTEAGGCDQKAIVDTDEVKYIRLNMLRSVAAEKIGSALAESFTEQTPPSASAEVKKQVEAFKSYFKEECTKGTVIEITYIPGSGTTIKQNNKELGPAFTGREFQRIFWSIYFGQKPSTKGLNEQVMKSCH